MKAQNYSNYVRYYIPHHFVLYPILLVCIGISVYFMTYCEGECLIWGAIATVFFLITVVSFMMRQHYALNNQNRIIRLEMYYRYFASTNKRLDTLKSPLSFSQLAALRFASDEEFVALTERTIQEKLLSDQIKKSIQNWKADYMRA
jgi:hypothetical protein